MPRVSPKGPKSSSGAAAAGMGHGHEDDSQVIETYRALLRKREDR